MHKKRIIGALLAGIIGTSAVAADTPEQKRGLNSNYSLVYNRLPGATDSFAGMFSDGMYYGRLRTNNFYYQWSKQTPTQQNSFISAVGGSLIFKSAALDNFDFGVGLYYSQAFFLEGGSDVSTLKASKGAFSRYNYVNTGAKNMGVLGQAYIAYHGIPQTDVIAGRQLVNFFYAKANDTKMIPNTFDGLVVNTTAVPDTPISLGYLVEEKLRDHTTAHSVLMYGDANSTSHVDPQWSENDEVAMHKGLTYTNLKLHGKPTAAPLITGDLQNTSIKSLKLNAAFYTVPELISQGMVEANYKIPVGGGALTPGVRYVKQFDNGAGAVGGAALNGTLAGQSGSVDGYKNASSLDSQMIAARLVGSFGNYKVNLGYTYVLNEADMVTPWRGFVTSGYTRSMAKYNWQANTKSYRIEVTRGANKTGMFPNFFVQGSILHTDADQSKGYYDYNYYYLCVIQNVPSLQAMQWRLRFGYTDTQKPDANTLDARFEVNYLF